MTQQCTVLSVYQGFFMGGARILHSDVIMGLHTEGKQRHKVLSLYSEVERECTIQKMEDDRCYQNLATTGITITSLGRRDRDGTQNDPYSKDELQQFSNEAQRADII